MAFVFREEALRGLVALREALEHLIGESFTQSIGGHATDLGSFSVDVFEQDAHYILQASLPGVKPEDLVIQAQGNLIVIRGERQLLGDQADQQWILREHQSITFSRSIMLPGAIDAAAASAQLEYGLLTLELPKAASVQIIPLGGHAAVSALAADADADSAPETLESSSALPTDSNADVAVDATATIVELEALAPAIEAVAEVAAPIAATDADAATTLAAEAIFAALQEAAQVAELAEVAGDESAAAPLAEIVIELAVMEELLSAEEIIVAELAEATAELQLDDIVAADEAIIAEIELAEAVTAEAAIIVAELAATVVALEIAEAISKAEADIAKKSEGVVTTVLELTPDALADVAASVAEVATAEALTEATIIAEVLVEEILHKVALDLVREIVAELPQAQPEALADVIAEALLTDVLSAMPLTSMPQADAIPASVDDAADLVKVPAKLEEIH